jgi:hypothetical protein
MKKLALAASFLLLAAVASAHQQKPNFSGTWVLVTPAESAGQEEEIRHTATEIAFGHPSEGGHGHHRTYKLDGSESRNVMTIHDQEIVTLGKAVWEGDRLVIRETTSLPEGHKFESRQTIWLNAEGQLVREMLGTMDGQAQPLITAIARKK